MQTQQTKLNTLKRRVEAGTYQPTAEAIVDAVEQLIALHERPVGSLTPVERETVIRIFQHNNNQARLRIQDEDVDRLYPISLCPVHRTPYPVQSGDRGRDCRFCRTEQENARYRFENFREEGGMAEGMVPPSPPSDQPLWGEGDDGEGRNWTQADERWATVVDGLICAALAIFALSLVFGLVTGRLL